MIGMLWKVVMFFFWGGRGGGPRKGLNLFQTLKGQVKFVLAPLANIFNKCYKKAVFMKNK